MAEIDSMAAHDGLPFVLSPEQAADLLGIHAQTVRDRLRKGLMPGVKPIGAGMWHITRRQFVAYVEGDWQPPVGA